MNIRKFLKKSAWTVLIIGLVGLAYIGLVKIGFPFAQHIGTIGGLLIGVIWVDFLFNED